MMDRKRASEIVKKLRAFHGDPGPELVYDSPYQLAIAVVLSAQTTDRQVNQATPGLFRAYPDFPALARAKIVDVEALVISTGFYHHKASNIVRLAERVVSVYGGKLPQSYEELVTLPGVGRKSANVILSVGFDIPAFAVDTHIIRLAGRIGFCDSRNPEIVERAITDLVPRTEWKIFHLLLIKHGRRICGARSPACGVCPIRGLCDYGCSIP